MGFKESLGRLRTLSAERFGPDAHCVFDWSMGARYDVTTGVSDVDAWSVRVEREGRVLAVACAHNGATALDALIATLEIESAKGSNP